MTKNTGNNRDWNNGYYKGYADGSYTQVTIKNLIKRYAVAIKRVLS